MGGGMINRNPIKRSTFKLTNYSNRAGSTAGSCCILDF
ncbi:hypothetical protein HMPREF0868_0535 [Mageeibacillus indolicus UPII9-5]|uniref:Uncharacterized protein n=1 Tax=Mageeibacillus indolicus (strain UPII9-5) TaxID=699246 RepID=D3R103_MAGIU|nr:hypothetical protein HMPREF0868_0535 [Mageeibacillus indolicus UPII9-5]